jgi:hypothetical protein
MLLFYFLFKNIINLSSESGVEIEKHKNYNIAANDIPESRNLLGKGKAKYDVFKPKANPNTEENNLGHRSISGDIVI